MSNYIEYRNKIAFHPGYYIKEYIDNLGLTQEDFANRLGTTPKNISYIVRGEQSISIDIAMKLSRMIGTTVKYWLNLQTEYDSLIAEFKSNEETKNEKEILKYLNYSYFRDNYNLPNIPKQLDKQIIELRKFLNVSSLTVFSNVDMYIHFRSCLNQNKINMIKANVMVQIATNISLKNKDIPKYDKNKFIKSIDYILTLTIINKGFYKLVRDELYKCGVDLIFIPNIQGSKINGACKKVGNHIMIMINDRNNYFDSFWFTLFHEIGHIINGDFGISFEDEITEEEKRANIYASDALIPKDKYASFIKKGEPSLIEIISFSKEINRDPSIVLARLRNDKIIRYDDSEYNILRTKYKFKIEN